MKNEEIILESLQSLVLHAAKTDERLAAFAVLLSNRLPSLSKKEPNQLQSNASTVLVSSRQLGVADQ